MEGHVRWTGGTGLDGVNAAGQTVTMDWSNGPSPMHLLLHSIGACSLVDVVGGLSRRSVEAVSVDLRAERRVEPPRSITALHMTYHVDGDVPEVLVRRLIEKSHSTYCSVSNSLREDIPITWDLVLNGS
jgi:putative redox protein